MHKPDLKPIILAGVCLGAIVTSSLAQAIVRSATNDHHKLLPLVFQTNLPEWIGPAGGTIMDVAINQQDPNEVYAASFGAGVFKSGDGGSTWSPINQGLENLFIYALAIDPAQPATLYAGTYQNKVYKSTDGGLSWFPSSQGIQELAIVYTIAINPQQTSTLYIGTRGESNNGAAPWRGVVYRSIDGGANWSPVLENIGGEDHQDWVYQVTVHPNSPNVVFAATHQNGPYRSLDYGETWQSVRNGVDDLSARTIIVDAQSVDPGTAYLGVWHRTGVYKSTDGGDSWSLKEKGIDDAKIYRMAISPLDSSTLYAATYDGGIRKSTNSGNKWSASGLRDEQLYSITIHPGDDTVLYSGSHDNGLFGSLDAGESWAHSHNGLNASQVTALLPHQADSQVLFGATFGGGMAISTTGGDEWADFNAGLDDRYIHSIAIHPADENRLYALTDTAGLFKCELGGECWVKTGDDLPTGTTRNEPFGGDHPYTRLEPFVDLTPEPFPAPNRLTAAETYAPLLILVFDPANPEIAYLGTAGEGLYKTTNGGERWKPSGLSRNTVWGLAIDPADPARIYAATDEGGAIKVSDDHGDEWESIPIPGLVIYSLSASPAAPSTIYAGTSQGVYRRTGAGWHLAGLPDLAIPVIAAHPARPGVVVAGSTNGVFVSRDGGGTWTPGLSGMAGVTIRSIHFDPNHDGRVYFGTLQRGGARSHFQFGP